MTESDFLTPGSPGDYLTNQMQVAGGSVLKTEDGTATVVTWLIFDARDTASADSTVKHSYALDDNQVLALADMLVRRLRFRGVIPNG